MKTKSIKTFLFILFAICNSVLFASNPLAIISDKSSGKIALHELIGQEIKISDNNFTVQSFTVKITNQTTNLSIDATGSFINKNISNQIRTIADGTQFLITNIVAKDMSGNLIKLPDMSFVISK